ncbi:hypothetical protein Bbelb_051230 [Branchiostoma belcheri]|nr:hypothetical protein Bbelb_051230 [Branchiostoma belcheri]
MQKSFPGFHDTAPEKRFPEKDLKWHKAATEIPEPKLTTNNPTHLAVAALPPRCLALIRTIYSETIRGEQHRRPEEATGKNKADSSASEEEEKTKEKRKRRRLLQRKSTAHARTNARHIVDEKRKGLTDLLKFKPVRGERQDRLARLPESYQSGCRDTVTPLTPLKNIKSEGPTPVSVQQRNVYYSPTCVVCLDNPPVKVWPCRHACLCRPCARRLKILSSRCPVCRQEYQKDPESEAERRSWEKFQENMAVLDSLDRIMDNPGKSEEQKAEARRKYEDYVRQRNGVATLLKAESQLLVAIHCIEIMNLEERTLKEDTRWLSHDEACSSLYNTLPAVLTSLDHEAPASIKLQATAAADPQVNSGEIIFHFLGHRILAQAHNTNVREYKDDTRKIVKFISAPGQIVHCPFNPAHVVKCCKVEDHFRKCSKDASARDEIAHNIARNGQRRRYRRASAFDKDSEATFKFATPAAKTFLTRKVPQLEWDFAVKVPQLEWDFAVKVPQLEWDFAVKVPQLEWDFAVTVPQLEWDFAVKVPQLEWDFAVKVPQLEWDFAVKVPQLEWDFAVGVGAATECK